MANAHITSTTDLAAPINFALMDDLFLDRAKQALVYLVATHNGELTEGDGSLTVKWRRYEQQSPTTTALTQPTGNVAFPVRAAKTPSLSDVTGTVAHYGAYFLLNREVNIVNPRGYEMELTEVLAEMAGRSLNRLCRDEMEDNATTVRAGGAGADNAIVDPITVNGIAGVVRTLKNNSAMRFTGPVGASTGIGTTPLKQAYLGFCHVDVAMDIERLAGFKSVESYSDQTPAFPNEIGFAQGIRFLETEEASAGANAGGTAATNNLLSTGGTSADVYDTVISGKKAVGSVGLNSRHPESVHFAGDSVPTIEMITHARGTSGVTDALNELSSMGWSFWAKFKITNSAWIRTFSSGATDYASL